MDEYRYKDTLVGLRIQVIAPGSVPVTAGKEPLQMVTLKHPAGAYLKAHAHTPISRTTDQLQECLIVKKGAASIDLYGPAPEYVKFDSVSLAVGDVFILMNGGYGIHIVEDAELIEVKNGPFVEDKYLIE
ncbi:MAG: hypothetical protein AAB372_00815 [Patescibacteria group bacterium]